MNRATINKNEAYYDEINIARGIALLCVLIGHAFPDAQEGMTRIEAYYIWKSMYSFHMGAFFFLSGFVSGEKLCGERVRLLSEIIKKFKRLLVPYFFYSFLVLFLKQVMENVANNQFELSDAWKIFLGVSPHGGMWYLWSLVVVALVCLVINQFSRDQRTFLSIGVICIVLFYIVPNTIFENVFKYFIYYSIGICFQQNYAIIKQRMKARTILIVSSVVALVFVLCVYLRGEYVISCLCGIWILLLLSIIISMRKDSRTYKVLDELGIYSYDIYLISYFVQVGIQVIFYKILSMPYWLLVVITFFCGAIIPYFLCKYVIRRIPILNKLLLGNWH